MKELSNEALERLLRSSEVGFESKDDEAPLKFIAEAVKQEACKGNNTDLEIAFRSVLSSELENGVKDGAYAHETVKLLIEYSCRIAQQVHSSEEDLFGDNSRRIPCMLLEDLLEWQTIAQIDKTWKLVLEPLTEMLTHESVFAKGSTILLRVCNGVLRRLSRSIDTELRGRILMFLAYIFPISERSAVNLYGKNNTTNITDFDTKEAFLGAADDSANINDGESRDGSRATGEGVGDKELGEEYMDLEMAPGDESKGAECAGGSDPYTEYTNFWSMQNLLSADLKNIKAADLRNSMNKVLATLERHTYTHYSTEQLIRDDAAATIQCAARLEVSTSPTSAAGSGSRSNVGQKYLTDSQLFLLELADSQFRQQVCIQILMACQHLRFAEAESYASISASGASGSVSTSQTASKVGRGKSSKDSVKDKDKDKDREVKETEAEKEKEKAEAEKMYAKLMLLKGIESRAFAVLANSQGGPRLCQALQQLLHRESFWRDWKGSACPPLENRKKKDVPIPTTTSSSPSSPSPGAGPLGAAKDDFQKKWLLQAGDLAKTALLWSRSLEEVNSRAKELSRDTPSYSSHIEAYKDADDPEAGIEEEYHPKHDALYCWRARRLLALENICAFRIMQDGDLAKGISFVEGKKGGDNSIGETEGAAISLLPLEMLKAPTYPSAAELAELAVKQKRVEESKAIEKSEVEVEEGSGKTQETEPDPATEAKPAPEPETEEVEVEANMQVEDEEGGEEKEEKEEKGSKKAKVRDRSGSKSKAPPVAQDKDKDKEKEPAGKGGKRKRK